MNGKEDIWWKIAKSDDRWWRDVTAEAPATEYTGRPGLATSATAVAVARTVELSRSSGGEERAKRWECEIVETDAGGREKEDTENERGNTNWWHG